MDVWDWILMRFKSININNNRNDHILMCCTLLSLCLILSSCSTSWASTGHIRGPHHPRSPRVATITSDHSGHHHHYVPQRPTPGTAGQPAPPAPILTHDKQLLHDKEHLKEDVGEWLFEDGKELTPEEMEFHYFKMHDFDNDSKLDGLEILQAISHILPMTEVESDVDLTGVKDANDPLSAAVRQIPGAMQPQMQSTKAELIKQRDEDFNYYVDLIDKVLEEDDINKDGYLSYFEYVVGRRRDEKNVKGSKNSN